MPFQSEEQRKYLWANEPTIAKRWEKYPKGYNTGGVSHLFRSKEDRVGFNAGSWKGNPGTDSRKEVRDAWKAFLEYRKDKGDKNWQEYMPIWIGANLAHGGYVRPEDSGVLGLADGGKIIKGQEHYLAYITPDEGKTLETTGSIKGSTPEGIPHYGGHLGHQQTSRDTRGSDPDPGGGRDPNRPQGMPEHLTYTAPVQTVTPTRTRYGPNMYDVAGEIKPPTTGDDDKGDGDARSKYLATMYDKPLTAKQKERQKKKIYDKWDKIDDPGWWKKAWTGVKTVAPILTAISSATPWGFGKLIYDQHQKKKALIKEIKTDIKKLTNLGATKYSPHVDTLLQKLEQKVLDLTQVRKRKDDEKQEDIPQVPVTVEDPSYMAELKAAMEAMRLLYGRQRVESPILADTSRRDAYLAAYRQKYLMGAEGGRVPGGYNTGGLSNLFRLKNR